MGYSHLNAVIKGQHKVLKCESQKLSGKEPDRQNRQDRGPSRITVLTAIVCFGSATINK